MEKNQEYYESLDKRTKEYKDWAANFYKNQSSGIGDAVEAITEATGIKTVVKAIAGDDCGCEERKEFLNNLFRARVECPTQEEWEFLKMVFETKPKLNGEVQRKMQAIYERLFSKKIVSSCTSCSFVKTIYNPFKRLYDKSL